MNTIQLGFKAFDPHELLCHFVALDSGLYKLENLAIELVDITFTADADLPNDLFQVSCGAALSCAAQGFPQRIVFVATDRPMFWLYSTREIRNINGLINSKIATYPEFAPPHHLVNLVLKKSGINVAHDINLLPARDDMARLGLLKSGNVDAAVISSAIPPAKIEQAGYRMLCCLGDELRIPTTGLAIDQSYLEKEPELVQTISSILKQSLSIIHKDPDMLGAVLQRYFDVDDKFKNATAQLYQQYFTANGRTTAEIAQHAIDSLCNALSISKIPDWEKIYCYSH